MDSKLREEAGKKTDPKIFTYEGEKKILLNRFIFSWFSVRFVVRSTDSGYIQSIYLIVVSISPYEIRIIR